MKQIRIIIATVLFSVFGFTQIIASDTTAGTTALPVELKFAGTFKNQPLIQLNFTGTGEDKVFSISITDETGIVLYSADVKASAFAKQFLLNTDDLGDAVLNFEITGRKTGKKVAYKVSRHTEVSEQMDIVKL